MLVKTFARETIEDPETGEVIEKKMEEFIPEFDIKVKIAEDKPTDRNYWTNVVMEARAAGLVGPASYWETIIEGKLPNKDVIMEELEKMQQAQLQSQSQVVNQQIQAEMQEKEKDRQASIAKQHDTNQSQILMTEIAKEGRMK
jgi:hypothetical protein